MLWKEKRHWNLVNKANSPHPWEASPLLTTPTRDPQAKSWGNQTHPVGWQLMPRDPKLGSLSPLSSQPISCQPEE